MVNGADSPEPIDILLVDDSRTARNHYSRLLGAHGYRVQLAGNVEQAQQLLSTEPFDLAIIDFYMPRANGDVLCRHIQSDSRCRHITPAILTASYSDEIIRVSLAAGASDCLFKDEPEELLLARIRAMVRSIEARKSLELERHTLAEILGSLSEGVYGVDTEGRLRFMNPAGIRLLGYESEDELVGKPPHETFHFAQADGRPIPRETCFLSQAYELGDELLTWDSVFWTRDGVAIWVECNVVPFVVGGRRQGSVIAFRDISQLREQLEKLNWQANHDSLTRLPNRRHFRESLDREFFRLKRSGETAAVLYIDLDRFKRVNDEAGHEVGDQLLAELGSLLAGRMRANDTLARLGGDEFGVILQNVTAGSVADVAQQFQKLIGGLAFRRDGRTYEISASIGVALMDRHTADPGRLLARADAASYRAKRLGGARFVVDNGPSGADVAVTEDRSDGELRGPDLAPDRAGPSSRT